jgi:mono/diheme cytochrome c family protein
MKATMKIFKLFIGVLPVFGVAVLSSCTASGDNPGKEYAPQMYHSVAYEPLTQIKDQESGKWLSNREDGLGEFYNSNINNPHEMNMRTPPANTVRRTANGMLPYKIDKDDYDLAGETVKYPEGINPEDQAILSDGKVLYAKFCSQCHGTNGQGDGKVGEVFLGVPMYNVGRVAELTEGHIYHTITMGRGRMGAHGSQIQPEDRWKIVAYVQTLQKQ